MFKKSFHPVDPKQDFPSMEQKILAFWEKQQSFQKLVEKNRSKNVKNPKRWSFLDGPITANNPMGVHHAWGRTYKDVFQRFHAMQGADQHYQNGFDCQGLWVEVEVEKKLGLDSKRDIMTYGLDTFSRACKKRVEKFAAVQTEQSKRLGQWMDWENSYFTMSEENNLAIWHFLKKVFEKGWLYKGAAAVPWCTRCGTALSQHELSDGGYADLTHKSVYVKFPISRTQSNNYAGSQKNKQIDKEFFLVWTTTPWTLSANVALAVDPNITYVRAKYKDETFILGKRVAQKKFKEAKIIEEWKGSDLVDSTKTQYESLYPELDAQKNTQRVVIPWDEVGEEEGTGIVHIAPGAGEEDNKLGKEFGLNVIVPIDEFGEFVGDFQKVSKQNVLSSADDIIAGLKQKGFLALIESITHRYPICWRCKTECVFRVVDEWFMSVKKIRPLMKKAAKKTQWIPESSGKRMQDWLDNMGDWIISRKRFWGLALPFYECTKCSELVVVGSKEELKKLATDPDKVDTLESLHRPWIDEIKITCPKCQTEVERIKDVGDCWLDAGIVPFSTMGYFQEGKNKKEWARWFPVDFIVESRPQIRLWFYSMLFMSVTLENVSPYKTAMTYESVVDEKGNAMHKSTGNAIWFDDAIEKMGADVMRWMYTSQQPIHNLRFGYTRGEEVRNKLISLWNVYSFFVTYANVDGISKQELSEDFGTLSHFLDQWIISLLQELIEQTTIDFEQYDTSSAVKRFGSFIEILSNWYVRRSRRRFWKSENDRDKLSAYQTLYHVLKTLAKIMAPILPFLSEEIYQNLKIASDPESVHHNAFPTPDPALQQKDVTRNTEILMRVVRLGRSVRSKSGIKVRQPLEKMIVKLRKDEKILPEFEFFITDELNVKHIEYREDVHDLAQPKVRINAQVLGPKIGNQVQRIIKLAREGSYEIKDNRLKIGDQTLLPGEYLLNYENLKENYNVESSHDTVVILYTKLTDELKREGLAREIVRAIQDLRKSVDLNIEDRIISVVQFDEKNGELPRMIEEFEKYIKAETLSTDLLKKTENEFHTKEFSLNGHNITIGIKKVKNV